MKNEHTRVPGHVSARQAVKVNRLLTSAMATINCVFISANVFRAYPSRVAAICSASRAQIGQYERCLGCVMASGQCEVQCRHKSLK